MLNQNEDDDIAYRNYDDDAWLENTYDTTDENWREADDEDEDEDEEYYEEGLLGEDFSIGMEDK